jgi:hypothetical protein
MRTPPPPHRRSTQQSLDNILRSLPAPSLRRFLLLRQRCFEMRSITSGVRGQADSVVDSPSRFARRRSIAAVPVSPTARLAERTRSFSAEHEREGARREADGHPLAVRGGEDASDERVKNSLQDSVADAELRLDNYRKAAKDAEFVAIELDRIETKIQALIEMGVSARIPTT